MKGRRTEGRDQEQGVTLTPGSILKSVRVYMAHRFFIVFPWVIGNDSPFKE